MVKAYVCFQSSEEATVCEGYNTNILGVCDSDERAQEICNHHGDSYMTFKMGEDTGRVVDDGSVITTYNIEGEFIKAIDLPEEYLKDSVG